MSLLSLPVVSSWLSPCGDGIKGESNKCPLPDRLTRKRPTPRFHEGGGLHRDRTPRLDSILPVDGRCPARHDGVRWRDPSLVRRPRVSRRSHYTLRERVTIRERDQGLRARVLHGFQRSRVDRSRAVHHCPLPGWTAHSQVFNSVGEPRGPRSRVFCRTTGERGHGARSLLGRHHPLGCGYPSPGRACRWRCTEHSCRLDGLVALESCASG